MPSDSHRRVQGVETDISCRKTLRGLHRPSTARPAAASYGMARGEKLHHHSFVTNLAAVYKRTARELFVFLLALV